MKRSSFMHTTRSGWLCCSLALAASASWSMQSGTTPQGLRFASGGVSHEELTALHAQKDRYSLWVITAALRTGAHLADVRVVIRDDKQQAVFDRRLDGPWLLIELPLGRYEIEASLAGEVQKRGTTIHRGDHHQAFFYFNTGDTVSPEQTPLLDRSPYDGTKK